MRMPVHTDRFLNVLDFLRGGATCEAGWFRTTQSFERLNDRGLCGGYPDCIAYRQLGDRQKLVKIELEYR
jgi:hypothetical protein